MSIQLATEQPGTPGISPYIASIESFHPLIQHELIRRSKSSEMADVYMPFVKLTSLSYVLGDNLKVGDGCVTGKAYCPSLGIHGEPEVSFDDIYNPTSGNDRSIIGYATDAVTHDRVEVLVTSTDAKNEPSNIPMPGITKMNTERTTAGSMGVRGGLFKATIDIRAYSVGQVNALLRYFLRPATRVILELGHRRANNQEEKIAQSSGGILYQKFNWNRSLEDINTELLPLVTLQKSQRYFIEKYIYGNFGNYEIFIGYVVDFKLKFTKENVYEIQLIVHSLQQFEVPIAGTGIQSLNQGNAIPDKCKVIEIKDYFDPQSGWKENSFSQLMANVLTGQSGKITERPKISGTNWTEHVIPLRGPGSAPGSGGNTNPGYLISWEFFVNVILNDETSGIMSVFQTEVSGSNPTVEFLRNSVLSKIESVPSSGSIDNLSLISNEVAWDKDLRSIDPEVLVIYNEAAGENETAVEIASILERLGEVDEAAAEDIVKGFTEGSSVKARIKSSLIGPFDQISTGTSALTKGVWINTNAIVDAFSGADTVSTALNNLLVKLNNATNGFWNLQIMSADTDNRGLHVVDMGLSKKPPPPTLLTNNIILNQNILESADEISKIQESVNKLGKFDKNKWTPTYLYIFNRGLGSRGAHDTGGELLDVMLESSLPQVIAIQAIAGVGGQMQRGTLEAIDINELRRISLYNTMYPGCQRKSTTDVCPSQESKTIQAPKGMPASIATAIRNLISSGREKENQSITAQLGKQKEEYAEICTEPTDESPSARKQYDECQRQKRDQAEQYITDLRAAARETYEAGRPGYLDLVSKYGARFGSVLDLIEYNVTKLQKDHDENSKKQEVHPFNSSNLTKTTVDLTTPGIGGIQLFQSFGVARVPNILDRGYYVVTKVNHEFGDSGWITKIQGRFRYNPDQTKSDPNSRPPCDSSQFTCPDTPPTTPAPTPAVAPTTPSRSSQTPRSSQQPAVPPTTREDPVVRSMPTVSNQELVERLEYYEGTTEEPRFGTINAREDWQRRVQNGSVERDKVRLEATKAEIRKRNNAGLQARRGIPTEFYSISDARLRPKSSGSSGSF